MADLASAAPTSGGVCFRNLFPLSMNLNMAHSFTGGHILCPLLAGKGYYVG